MPVTGLVDRRAGVEVLDAVARRLSVLADRIPAAVRDVLHGLRRGHPLYPDAAEIPVGAWIGACTLDVAAAMSPSGRDREGIEQAATILIATGLVGLPVAALPGAADWSLLPPERRLLGLVHVGANAFAAVCMGASLVARSRGRRGCGLGWAFGGVALAGAGAAIGSHLRHRFVADPAADSAAPHPAAPHPAAGEWTEIGPLDDLPQRRPQVQSIGDRRVVVVRCGEEVNVLADTCSHLSGPLSDGMISELDGWDRIVCPWHGSTFELGSGLVVHGPATAPQPVFDVRIVDGIVSARAGEPRAGRAHRRAGARRATWAFTVPWK